MAAIAITATAANAARPIFVSAIGRSWTQRSHSGNGCVPSTLSMTIFSGHGPAMLIAVSTTMAANTTTSHPRYGRTRSSTSLLILPLATSSGTGVALALAGGCAVIAWGLASADMETTERATAVK